MYSIIIFTYVIGYYTVYLTDVQGHIEEGGKPGSAPLPWSSEKENSKLKGTKYSRC
jgi:hypothetical protein